MPSRVLGHDKRRGDLGIEYRERTKMVGEEVLEAEAARMGVSSATTRIAVSRAKQNRWSEKASSVC